MARPAGRMRGLKESESGQIGVTRIAGTVGRTKEPPAAVIIRHALSRSLFNSSQPKPTIFPEFFSDNLFRFLQISKNSSLVLTGFLKHEVQELL